MIAKAPNGNHRPTPLPASVTVRTTKPPVLTAGGECTCRPGRYVRYVIPPVPGCEPTVYCRAVDAANEGRASHPIPPGAVLMPAVRVVRRKRVKQ